MNKHTKEIEFMYQLGIFLRDLWDAAKFFGIVIAAVGLICVILELL